MKGQMNRSEEVLDFSPVQTESIKQLRDQTLATKITKAEYEDIKTLAKMRDVTVSQMLADYIAKECKKNREEIDAFRNALRASRRRLR